MRCRSLAFPRPTTPPDPETTPRPGSRSSRRGGDPTQRSRALRWAGIVLVGVLAGTGSEAAGQPLRLSFDLRVATSPTPVVLHGERRLVYELHVASYAAVPLELARLDVLGADGAPGQTLASWSGEALAERVGVPGVRAPETPLLVAPAGHVVLYVDVPLTQGGPVPAALRHRVAFDVVGPDGREPAVVEGGDVVVDGRPPLVLGAPLRGGPWVAVYDPAMARGHRRVVLAVDGRARIPARFAVDYVRVDAEGRTAAGDPAQVANAYGYGEDVLAVADAVVAAVRDSVPEAPTVAFERRPLREASGNFVTLALGDGRYVHYEHLRAGSVRVRPGERVRRGQAVGALGNSGDSTGPHLHLHVSDGASPLAGEGVPYVVERFEALGAYPSIAAFAEGGPWAAIPHGKSRARRMEFPEANTVVDFGGGMPPLPPDGDAAAPSVCDAPEHRQFDLFLGDWDAYEVGDPATAVARTRVTRALGGCALREVFEQTDGLVGESLSAYDAGRGVWHQSWVTNRGGLLLLDGGLDADGRMVLTAAETAADGATTLLRGTWWVEGEAVRERADRSADGGTTWAPVFDIVFRPHAER